MPNTPRQDKYTAPTPQQKGQTIPDNDSLETDDRGTRPFRGKSAQQRTSIEDANAGRPEIGDPVPEDQRTIRARGETGEDEDLPDERGI